MRHTQSSYFNVVLSNEQQAALSLLRPDMDAPSRASLDFPCTIALLNPNAIALARYQSSIGSFKIYDQPYFFEEYLRSSKELIGLVAQEICQRLTLDLPHERNKDRWFDREHAEDKILGLKPIVKHVLLIDKKYFRKNHNGPKHVKIRTDYDHSVVDLNNIRTARWHRDFESYNVFARTRIYIIRIDYQGEFIAEKHTFGKPPPPQLDGMNMYESRSHLERKKWVRQAGDLIWRSPKNSLTAMTPETLHHTAEPDEPVPAAFLRISVEPSMTP